MPRRRRAFTLVELLVVVVFVVVGIIAVLSGALCGTDVGLVPEAGENPHRDCRRGHSEDYGGFRPCEAPVRSRTRFGRGVVERPLPV